METVTSSGPLPDEDDEELTMTQFRLDSAHAELDYRREVLTREFAAANSSHRRHGWRWLRRHRGPARQAATLSQLPVEASGGQPGAEHARVA
ncbi:MAG: hypothetical protein ACR2KJ_15070 [Jatrophihabitans sp.]